MATYPASPIPSYSYTKEVQYKTITSQFENGAEQRRNKWSQGKRLFTLIYNALTVAEATTLHDFFIARKGSFESFSYVDLITSTTYTVRFVEDGFSMEEFTYTAAGIGLVKTMVKFIQVL